MGEYFKAMLEQHKGEIVALLGDDFKRLIAETLIDVDLHNQIRSDWVRNEKPEALYEYVEVPATAVLATAWTTILDIRAAKYVPKSLHLTRVAAAAGVAGYGLHRLSVYDWDSGPQPRPCQVFNCALGAAAFVDGVMFPIPDHAKGIRLETYLTQARTIQYYATLYPWREDMASE